MGQLESILIAVITVLVGVGFWLLDRGNTVLGITCFVIACLIAIAYLIQVKIRPLIRARQVFLDAVNRNGFAAMDGRREKKAVKSQLRLFPGFDDLSLSVAELHTLETDSGVHIAGLYSLGGQGLNFGYFLAGEICLAPSSGTLPLDKIQDRDIVFEKEDEQAMKTLPNEVENAIRALPYDFSLRNNFYLVDFDARILNNKNFGESFDGMLIALIELSQHSER